ncbi:MAG: hypothetical protein JNL01_16485 [Bdellovibrionales bacterium]|nr:hypothetical protein [Bdellovibrionales bacterium]
MSFNRLPLLWVGLAFAATGCELTSTDRQIVSDSFDPSVTSAPPAPPIPVTQIPACHVERFTQPQAVVTEKLDLLLVVDTSGSLNAERGKLADAMDAFVRALPSTLDYRIAVMPAHGPHSQWAGKIFRRNKNEAWILDSESMSLATIQSELKDRLTKQSEIPNDSKSDGGEMGIYSLLRALDTDRVALARSQGFFRTDAALVSVFMSDENDICAVYPSGVTPVPDPQGAEKKALAKDCAGVTKEALASKLASFMGDRPYVTAAVIYNNLSTVPRGKSAGENELGYGYLEFVQATGGITIDMADANYRTGMEALGNRAAVRMNLKSDFTLARAGLSAASVVVTLDGAEVPYTLADPGAGAMASVKLASPGLPSSTIDVTYCVAGADTVPPVLTTKPADFWMISRGVRPVSGSANEALSSISVSVGSLSPVALTLSNDRLSFSGSLDFGAPGLKSLLWIATDMAGNRRRLTTQVDVSPDVTAPVIAGGPDSPILTNQVQFTAPITVTDESSVNTKVFLNGLVVQETSALSFTLSTTLAEGMNAIKIESTDAVGLTSSRDLAMVTLDTVAPVLTGFSPTSGASIATLSFPVNGSVNEVLSQAVLNTKQLSLSGDGKSFSGIETAIGQGPYVLAGIITDLAGNATSFSVPVSINLSILQAALVVIQPLPDDPTKLMVQGMPGAAYAGSSLTLRVGFFSQFTATAASDGTFLIESPYFTSARLTAVSPSEPRSESIDLSYNSTTLLSGVVLDTEDRPLPNAKVSISGRADINPVMTNAAGIFIITQKVTGDQTLLVDGSQVTDPCTTCTSRKFTNTSLKISVGLNQTNALQRPIYLPPVLQDGTAVAVTPSQGGTVTSPHAPGVSLEIPADAMTSAGNTPIEFSMGFVDAKKSSAEVPEFAVPDQVLNLEPSGMVFSKRIDVTLPNDNELPAGANLLIFSFDSKTGSWAPDGVAVVTPDGQSVKTKPGMGISHFSQIYAVPPGIQVSQMGAQDKPGTTTFDGGLTAQVDLPSYKVLGADVAPGLIYNSRWAAPTVTTTNLITLPSVQASMQVVQGQTILQKLVFFFDPSPTVSTFYQIVPEKIEATFQTTGVLSEKMPVTGVPRESAISFNFDLGHLQSGVYPYISHWDVYLRHINLVTVQKRKKKYSLFGPLVNSGKEVFDNSFTQYAPSDFSGQIFVQNKMNSAIGQGWKVQGPARIVNPTENKLMIEESDGRVSTYSIENSISTVVNTASTDMTVTDFGRIQWPNLLGLRRNLVSGRYAIGSMDLSNPSTVSNLATTLPNTDGIIRHNWTHVQSCGFLCTSRTPAHIETGYFAPRLPSDALGLPDGRLITTSAKFHTVHLSANPGDLSGLLAGGTTVPPTSFGGQENPAGALNFIQSAYCNSALGVTCNFSGRISGHRSSEGHYPLPGAFKNGSTGSLASDFLLNRPGGLAQHPFRSVVAIADTGNHRVIEIDLSTGATLVIAGNQQTVAKTDGVPASQSSLVNPVSLQYDSGGRLIILTEEGYIRLVDTGGIITTIAGRPWNDPDAIFSNQGPSSTFALKEPRSIVLDEENATLYVSDTGYHRIVAFDVSFGGNTAWAVAGNGTPGFNGDKRSALDAQLNAPMALALDPDKNLLFIDSKNERVRRVIFNRSTSTPLTYSPTAEDNTLMARDRTTGSFTRTLRDGTVQNFDADGFETSVTTRTGRTVSYAYDSNHLLKSQTDPTGRMIQYRYTGGKLSEIEDPAGRITYLNHVGNYLQSVKFPDQTTRSFGYATDGSGRIESETNANGYTTQYQYNNVGRLSKVIRPDGKAITLFDVASGTVANGYTAGNAGQIKPQKQEGTQNEVTDPRNIKVTMKPDAKGYISIIKDPNGIVTKIDRNSKGQPLVIYKDFKDNGTAEDDRDDTFESKVTFTYDSVTGDLLSKVDSATGHTETRTYNSFGQTLTEKSITGITVTHVYDPVTGLETETRDSVNGILGSVTYAHPLKLPTRKTDAHGKVSDFTYDQKGNLETQETPIDSSRKAKVVYTRDDAGNILTAKNPNGDVTTYEYDDWNRLTAVISAENERTEYTYSFTGKLTQVKDAKANLITYNYNSLDQLEEKVDQLGKVYTYQYDDSGNLNYEKDPNGNIKRFTYNNRNQIESKILPDDQYDFTYDGQGNLKFLSNQNYSVQINLDSENRLVQSIQSHGQGLKSSHPDVTLAFSYDEFDRRKSMTTPSGTIDYEYDSYSRIKKVTNEKSEAFTFEYDLLGRESRRTRPGSQTVLSFDDGSFLKTITHTGLSGSSLNLVVGYDRDLSGLRTGVNRSGISNLTLGYDKNQQLTSSASSNTGLVPNESYDYDEIHNRKQDHGGTYAYDLKSQQLTEDYRNFYFYDENGNLISKQAKGLTGEVTSFAYTSENQLKSVKVFAPGAPQSQFFVIGTAVPVKEIYYFYDPMGRRVEKQVIDHQNAINSLTRRYVYDGQDLITELDEGNQILASYTHRLNPSDQVVDDVLSVNVTSYGQTKGLAQTSGSYHFVKDGLGSVTEVTNSGGHLVQRVVYATFGKILSIRDANANDVTSSPVLKTHFAFTGREYDEETGNYYYRARYYDPNIGRFLQKDPEPGLSTIPASVVNNYSYVKNLPTGLVDPTGKSWIGDFFEGILNIAGSFLEMIVGLAVMVGGLAYGILSFAFSLGQNTDWDYLKLGSAIGLAGLYRFGGGFELAFSGGRKAIKGAKALEAGAIGGLFGKIGGYGFNEGFKGGFAAQVASDIYLDSLGGSQQCADSLENAVFEGYILNSLEAKMSTWSAGCVQISYEERNIPFVGRTRVPIPRFN